MNKKIFPVIIGVALLSTAFVSHDSVKWHISKGYSVKFTTKKVTGLFKTLKGDIHQCSLVKRCLPSVL